MMNGEPACIRGRDLCVKGQRCSAGIFRRLGRENWRSRQYQQRIKDLQILQLIISCLIGEISYARNTLPEAFSRISEKVASPFQEYLQSVAKRLKEQTGEAFVRILKEQEQTVRQKTSLREEDWDLFLQTLGHLGYLDAKMQIQLLESGRTELAMREEKLQHQLPEQKRVWQSLGILGGAFLVVILI